MAMKWRNAFPFRKWSKGILITLPRHPSLGVPRPPPDLPSQAGVAIYIPAGAGYMPSPTLDNIMAATDLWMDFYGSSWRCGVYIASAVEYQALISVSAFAMILLYNLLVHMDIIMALNSIAIPYSARGSAPASSLGSARVPNPRRRGSRGAGALGPELCPALERAHFRNSNVETCRLVYMSPVRSKGRNI